MKPSDENPSLNAASSGDVGGDPLKAARRAMSFISLITLATVGIAVLCTKVTTIEAALNNIDRHSAEERGTLYEDKGYFQDRCERMVFEDIPQNDDKKPGVYLFGSSLVVHALRLWDAEPWEREYIHDRAVKGSNALRLRHLCQYLVERGNKVSADNQKKLLIFGIGYTSAIGLLKHHQVYFKHLWEDHHFYKYDEQRGIEEVPYSPLSWFYRTNRIKTAGFVNAVHSAVEKSIKSMSGAKSTSNRNTKPNIERMKVIMGPNWEQKIDDELKEIGILIDYCQSQNVRFQFVLMPMATWVDELPCKDYFNDGLKKLCEQRGVAILDLSQLVPDEEYVDSAHYTVRGAKLFTDKIAEIAKPFLIEANALPKE